MKNIFIVAGEPSGDLHAAKLMQSLKELQPNIHFYGIGGKMMEAEGLHSLIPMEKISVIGIVEVVKHIFTFLKLNKQCKQIMQEKNIDCFIPVDYPGFNIKLARFAISNGIPVYYYIAPQLWAWGKNRWKKLKNAVTKLLVVFPFEEKYFQKHSINAKFVGHPLLDRLHNVNANERSSNIVAFFPGSRTQEVKHNLPLLIDTIKEISDRCSTLTFVFAVSPNVNEETFDILKDAGIRYELNSNAYDLMKKAAVGIVKVGTTALEAAICGMPMIVAYKTSASHYWFGKRVINLDYITLPNILLNRKVVDEYIQQDATPQKLALGVIDILNDEHKRKQQLEDFATIRQMLGEKGASKNAAKLILSELS
jgi:lipid-A-disaccharide synthase